MEMKISDPLRRGWTNGGNFRSANLARVVVEFVKHFEKRPYAVRTGEHDPVVKVRVLDQLSEFAQIGRRFDPDCRQFENIGAKCAKLIAQRTGLFARPR